jgi:hypothetical protein
MSYCANANYVLSGKDFSKYKLEMTFTPRGGDSLRKFAMEAPCITPPANPVVILTSPRGSVTYPGDTTISIHWSFANLQNVSLEFSSDGGAKWNAIASNVGASSGILPWKVPNLASQKMLVRIFDATSDTVADTSLLFFSATKTAAIAETPSNPLSFTLRPDPAHDELSIMPSINIRNIHCDILDERGVVIQQVNGNADDCSGLSVSLRSLPAGTYLVHITSPVDTVITFVHYP